MGCAHAVRTSSVGQPRSIGARLCDASKHFGAYTAANRAPRRLLQPAFGVGAASELLHMPERSKQHARRLPAANMSHAVAMRLTRVSAFLPETTQKIRSRRATAVMSSQVARAAASAAFRSSGTTGSGASATGAISSATVWPADTPAACCKALSSLSQCPHPAHPAARWPAVDARRSDRPRAPCGGSATDCSPPQATAQTTRSHRQALPVPATWP